MRQRAAETEARIQTNNAAVELTDRLLEEAAAGRDIAALLRARNELREGQACPVCGSTAHRSEAAPTLEVVEVSAVHERRKRDALVSEAGELAQRLSHIAAETERADHRIAAVDSELAAELALAAKVRGGAQSSDTSEILTQLRGFAETQAQRVEAFERRAAAVAVAAEQLRHCERRHADLTTAIVEPESALSRLEASAAAATTAWEAAEKRRASMTDKMAGLLEQFRTMVSAAGLDSVGVASARDAAEMAADMERRMAQLSHRRSLLREKTGELREIEAAEAALKGRLDQLRQRGDALRVQALAAADAASAAQSEANGWFDGRNPDAVQAESESTVAAARTRVHEMRRAAADLMVAQSRQKGALSQLMARRQQLLAEQDTTKPRLMEVLAQLECANFSELRQRELREETRAEWSDALAQAQARKSRAAGALSEHQNSIMALDASRPSGADLAGAAGSHAARIELDEKVAALEQQRGAIAERLAADTESRRQHDEQGGRLARMRHVFNTWETLHRLIGVGEGAEFRAFAQSLNLSDLIWRANRHLERLEPRYSLAADGEDEGRWSLSFVIRDMYLANTTRPLNTLSGGETFLVSLALALALAEYSTARLRIETLMLDEGFGTLDADTLRTAITALERLHVERDAQVFMISHVEGLKERMPARIRVEKLGGGRSRVVLERP